MEHIDNASGLPQIESMSVPDILRKSVACRSFALVLDLETEWVSKADFVAFTGKSVTFNTYYDKSDSHPLASACCVAFVYSDSSCAFLATVLGFHARPAPEPSQLELESPSRIAVSKGHIRYRVPVFKDSGFEVHAIAKGRRLHGAQALNLSLTGILIEFPATTDPHLPVGADLHVTLALGDQGMTFAGEVVRTQGRQYGICFRDVGGAGIIDPPEPLRKIVRVLERRWLRERVRTADQNAKDQSAPAQNIIPDRRA